MNVVGCVHGVILLEIQERLTFFFWPLTNADLARQRWSAAKEVSQRSSAAKNLKYKAGLRNILFVRVLNVTT
jgi:hypothetical protein